MERAGGDLERAGERWRTMGKMGEEQKRIREWASRRRQQVKPQKGGKEKGGRELTESLSFF